MKDNTVTILFALLRSAISGNLLSKQENDLYTAEMLPKLVEISRKHDISHLLALGIHQNQLLTEKNNEISNDTLMAIYRYEKMNYELCKFCEVLEKLKIPFIPLKGSVLRKFYPEPWMRTSCDIDILVHEEDLRDAISYLVDNLNYTKYEQNMHDVSLFSPGRIHIELHYKLVEDGLSDSLTQLLMTVWNTATLKSGHSYFYEMPDNMFYFYHIAHMAKHFENGGCGIRPFIDLWILDNIDGIDIEKRNTLLDKGGLLRFSEVARKLSKVWLENASLDSIPEKMQNYILSGGVYGTLENRIAVQQQKKGGRIKYAFSKIIIPYDTIKFHYPILQKYRWLTPFMQVCRWFKLAFCGHAKRTMRELSYNQNISSSQADDMKVFLNEIGL